MTLKKTFQEKCISYATKGCISLLVLAVCAFAGMKVYPLIHGPAVTVQTLADGVTVTNPMVQLSGKALYTKELALNGTSMPLSPDGSFADTIVLNPGYNVISLMAEDQFGKISRHDYEVVLQAPQGLSYNNAASLPQ